MTRIYKNRSAAIRAARKRAERMGISQFVFVRTWADKSPACRGLEVAGFLPSNRRAVEVFADGREVVRNEQSPCF